MKKFVAIAGHPFVNNAVQAEADTEQEAMELITALVEQKIGRATMFSLKRTTDNLVVAYGVLNPAVIG